MKLTGSERGRALLDAIYEDVDHRLNPDMEECWHCGGDGVVFDCIDGFCEDAESGCEMCTRPCLECRLFAGRHARAVREEVIKSGDVDIAREWLKDVKRWSPDISDDRIREELDSGRRALSEQGADGK